MNTPRILMPKHLYARPKGEQLEFLANKVAYYHAMADHYKRWRRMVEVGKLDVDYTFEEDKESSYKKSPHE